MRAEKTVRKKLYHINELLGKADLACPEVNLDYKRALEWVLSEVKEL